MLEREACLCVGPGYVMRLLTPGSAWLLGPETGLKNGSVKGLPPSWRTSSGPKHNNSPHRRQQSSQT
ncbi:hypothetical protein INR49_032206 [Caranx melampygus]|nr:hypothetical protein INR49_032206 [Caranx melampygus]